MVGEHPIAQALKELWPDMPPVRILHAADTGKYVRGFGTLYGIPIRFTRLERDIAAVADATGPVQIVWRDGTTSEVAARDVQRYYSALVTRILIYGSGELYPYGSQGTPDETPL